MNNIHRKKADAELRRTLSQQFIDVCLARGMVGTVDDMIAMGGRLLVPTAYGKQKNEVKL